VPDADPAALTRLVLAAARELNAGRYFEAHEALEEHLDEVPDPYWPLFLGLIQVAVGYHKLASGNDGASRMLGIGLEKLASFDDAVLGIDLGALRARAALDRARLEGHDAAGAIDGLRRDPPRLLPVATR
jgi:predicted metal-dependent hydrolase